MAISSGHALHLEALILKHNSVGFKQVDMNTMSYVLF